MTDSPTPLWAPEFPDYPAHEMPAIPAGWQNTSWHNDVCPSFKTPSNLQVFVDFADPAQREMQGERFSVNRMDIDGVHVSEACTIFVADAWADVLAFVAGYITPHPTKAELESLADYAARAGGESIESEMSAELERYATAHGLPLVSADEMMAETESAVRASYLAAFVARWEAVTRVTDAQNADPLRVAAVKARDFLAAHMAAHWHADEFPETAFYEPWQALDSALSGKVRS